MLNSVDFSGKPFHFIGIGGIGMSALAYILAKRRFPVSGSDLRSSHITQHLQKLGVHIFWQQDATNLEFFQVSKGSDHKKLPISKFGSHGTSYTATLSSTQVDSSRNGHSSKPQSKGLPQVICSTAIHPDNAEYQAALALGCPIFHRSDLLAALMQEYQSIAVAGTHGKTTTSSLIGYMLLQADLDPTIVVGGEVHAWEGNARLGQGPYLVAEADESDGSFVKFSPQIGVITNIELDHPDHYQSLDQLIDTFKTFAERCHTLVGCFDCPTIREWIGSSQVPPHQPLVSYSLHAESDYTVDNVTYCSDGTTAQVWERGQILGQLHVKLLGRHNLSNALAAVAVGRLLGLDFATIAQAIATFEGACRRFECRGKYNNILFIDDYAHHPSEIRETLAAARLQIEPSEMGYHSRKRIVAVFQPHRYSRTLAFLAEFSQAFTDADIIVSTDIYSAGEPDPGRINGRQLADLIAVHHTDVHYQSSLQSAADFLKQSLKPGDLVIFLGAGNLNQIIPEVMTFYQNAAVRTTQEVAFP